ncbi:hypothetical protein NK214_12135 [Chromobacterium sp. S0633]|uniref:hypothetical protein n=1 Tax=Chromobacterium sp. S0633 TaxID=2957805 RepID=UPI00209E33AF|nr:hypothetical protein [Chromobacterium sp. S0633]MCP1290939.1 hypothetical protein [Chromobacterium sp. S0633]
MQEEKQSTSCVSDYKKSVVAHVLDNFFVFAGTILIAIVLAFIPYVGWFLGLILFFTGIKMLFSKRTKVLKGPCPKCATAVRVNADVAGFNCPACSKRIIIKPGQFELVD